MARADVLVHFQVCREIAFSIGLGGALTQFVDPTVGFQVRAGWLNAGIGGLLAYSMITCESFESSISGRSGVLPASA